MKAQAFRKSLSNRAGSQLVRLSPVRIPGVLLNILPQNFSYFGESATLNVILSHFGESATLNVILPHFGESATLNVVCLILVSLSH